MPRHAIVDLPVNVTECFFSQETWIYMAQGGDLNGF